MLAADPDEEEVHHSVSKGRLLCMNYLVQPLLTGQEDVIRVVCVCVCACVFVCVCVCV